MPAAKRSLSASRSPVPRLSSAHSTPAWQSPAPLVSMAWTGNPATSSASAPGRASHAPPLPTRTISAESNLRAIRSISVRNVPWCIGNPSRPAMRTASRSLHDQTGRYSTISPNVSSSMSATTGDGSNSARKRRFGAVRRMNARKPSPVWCAKVYPLMCTTSPSAGSTLWKVDSSPRASAPRIEMKVRSAVPSVNATQNPESTLSSVGPTCRMSSLSKTLRIVSAQGPVPRMPACRASTPIWRTACSVL